MENNVVHQTNENSSQKSIFERITNSMILKIFIIFILMLILMIPMNLVDNLIQERKFREQNVSAEIASKWGLQQVISSPIIAVPYEIAKKSVEKQSDGTMLEVQNVNTEWAFLLTNKVLVEASVVPEILKRGIYQVVVYNSKIEIKGDFLGFELEKLKIPVEKLRWKEAKMVFGIQDFKGLAEKPIMKWSGHTYEMEKNNQELNLFGKNLYVDLPLENNLSLNESFEISMNLKGSKSLNILPLAKQTHIKVEGEWANPSFNGSYLPDQRQVGTSFKASWNIPSFDRKKPQQWEGDAELVYTFSGIDMKNYDQIEHSAPTNLVPSTANSGLISNDIDMVQINFLPAVNNYQKTTRVTKYGVLVIALTFVSLVFLEVITKQRIHIVQYILIGFAMVLFYALLLAISEHFGFNLAYLIAGMSTVVLITTFIRAITSDKKSALLFGGILALFYSFIFVLLQLRDFSLIVGTIGLFITLAVLMRLSSKIDWFQFEKK